MISKQLLSHLELLLHIRNQYNFEYPLYAFGCKSPNSYYSYYNIDILRFLMSIISL